MPRQPPGGPRAGSEPDTDPAPRALAPPRLVVAAIRRGYDEGVRAHGPLGLSPAEFEGDVLALVVARRAGLRLETIARDLPPAIAALSLPDLYLARACERGSADGWRAVAREFTSRLTGLAVRRGARGADADALAGDLLSDLALPAPGGRARTLLGTYAGTGSLWAWLAASLVRRVARRGGRTSAETAGPTDGAAAATADAPPWRDHVDAETARQLDAALRDAWGGLEPEERTCILLKHRHGVAQRRVADLLGVPEYQVSRWLARAVAKIRGAVDRHAGPDAAADGGTSLWSRLGEVVERRLASFEAAEPHPAESPAIRPAGETPQ